MRLSYFNNLHDREPKPLDVTWERFCNAVQSPKVREAKEGTLFSGATFNGTRAKENVTEVSMLVLDYDQDCSLNEEWAIIRESGLTAALYTTHSHQRETQDHPYKRDAFRVCLPLETPIPADKYPLLWTWAFNLTGQKIDRSAKDGSRMFYTPVKHSEESPYEWRVQDGEMLNWESLDLRDEPVHTIVNTPVQPATADKYVKSAFNAEIAAVISAGNGNRNNQLNESAFALGQFVGSGHLSESEVSDALERAAKGLNLSSQEARSTIRSGIRAGVKSPRVIPENPYTANVVSSSPLQVQSTVTGSETPKTEQEEQIVYDIGDHAEGIIEYRAKRAVYEDASTGWLELDEYYQPVRPAFTVVLGQANSGKSSVLDNLICNLYKLHDWSFVLFSMETQPTFLHQAMIISILANKPYSPHVEGGLTDNEIKEWCRRLQGKFIFHSLPMYLRNVDGIVALANIAKQKYNTQAMLLDPVAELLPPSRLVGGMTDYLQGEITKFRQCLYDTEQHGWMVVHPPKSPPESRGKSSERVLDPEDASGSKHFQNKADYIWVVHRWDRGQTSDHTEVFIKKVRRGFPGKLGSVRFDWKGPIGTYHVKYLNGSAPVVVDEYESRRYGKDY